MTTNDPQEFQEGLPAAMTAVTFHSLEFAALLAAAAAAVAAATAAAVAAAAAATQGLDLARGQPRYVDPSVPGSILRRPRGPGSILRRPSGPGSILRRGQGAQRDFTSRAGGPKGTSPAGQAGPKDFTSRAGGPKGTSGRSLRKPQVGEGSRLIATLIPKLAAPRSAESAVATS
ncbi:hypothetical protein CYMTET_7210 [Cymbomonas tetramitiformis]|uniref:Uncharacterized protein n=1 Tax=Cymbomonas tetramitiformis TaxID=36881 RepID=A0AAE0GW40_9CHLO|nr:hypothetical protein CYMTET_7210 [Cymbomonas tetramitiformis]